MLNQVVLIGRLGRDPELRHTQSGIAVASFSLAVERDFADKTTGQKDVDWIDIVVWRKLAEVCSQHLSRGRLVAVAGRLQVRSYDDRDGNKRKATEVVADTVKFLDYGNERQEPSAVADESVDDLPF